MPGGLLGSPLRGTRAIASLGQKRNILGGKPPNPWAGKVAGDECSAQPPAGRPPVYQKGAGARRCADGQGNTEGACASVAHGGAAAGAREPGGLRKLPSGWEDGGRCASVGPGGAAAGAREPGGLRKPPSGVGTWMVQAHASPLELGGLRGTTARGGDSRRGGGGARVRAAGGAWGSGRLQALGGPRRGTGRMARRGAGRMARRGAGRGGVRGGQGWESACRRWAVAFTSCQRDL